MHTSLIISLVLKQKKTYINSYFHSYIGCWLAHNQDNFYKTLHNRIKRRYTNFVLHQDENIIVVSFLYSISHGIKLNKIHVNEQVKIYLVYNIS